MKNTHENKILMELWKIPFHKINSLFPLFRPSNHYQISNIIEVDVIFLAILLIEPPSFYLTIIFLVILPSRVAALSK